MKENRGADVFQYPYKTNTLKRINFSNYKKLVFLINTMDTASRARSGYRHFGAMSPESKEQEMKPKI